MKINIYSIQKKSNDEFSLIADGYIKMSKKFASVNDIQLFPQSLIKVSSSNTQTIQKLYTQIYEPFIKNGFNVALDVKGTKVDSYEFAKILQDKNEVNFFIGGAFGFEREFLKEFDSLISLGALTMPHRLAHIILCEQTFRGLCINNNHPYHK